MLSVRYKARSTVACVCKLKQASFVNKIVLNEP